MKHADLTAISTSDLAKTFLMLAIAKGQAVMGDQTSKANRLYRRIDAILSELKVRSGDQRRVLCNFYDHRDPSVRLEAATATLAVDPVRSQQVLKSIWDRNEFPFAGHAGMLLHSVHTGSFRPT